MYGIIISLLTWMQCWHVLAQSVIFQHVEQCCFTSIVQAQENQLPILFVQTWKKSQREGPINYHEV